MPHTPSPDPRADGAWVVLKFGGTSVSPGPFVFHLDITYHITVKPAK